MFVDFKRTVSNSLENSKFISKQRLPVVVNNHPENKTAYLKILIFQDELSDSDTITNKTEQKNILLFSGSISSKIKMYDFNFKQSFKNWESKTSVFSYKYVEIVIAISWCKFENVHF